MDNIPLRIKEIMSLKKLNQVSFSKKTGIAQANLSKILSGDRPCGEAIVNKIVMSLDINKRWLLTGEGEMTSESMTSSSSSFSLPFLDIDASAGFSEIDASNGAMKLYSFPRCDAAMPVRGLSMEPNIHDGDIAAFVMLPSPASMRPDGIYIVQYDDSEGFTHITVKRAKQSPLGSGYIRLAADNPEYGYEDVPLPAISRVALVKFTITPISY